MAPQQNRPEPKADSVTRMFRLDNRGTRRGVDDVIDRLRQPDGWAWWESIMKDYPPTDDPDPSRAALEHLSRAKETHKAVMLKIRHGPDHVRAMALYYVCIAAAIAHYKTLLTKQDRAALKEALLDLSAATPDAWAKVFKRATER